MTTSTEPVTLESLDAFAQLFLRLGKLSQRVDDNLVAARQLLEDVRQGSEAAGRAGAVDHASDSELGDLSLEAVCRRLEAVERRLDVAGFSSAHGSDATEAGAA